MPIGNEVPPEIRSAFESGVADFLDEPTDRERIRRRSLGIQVFTLASDKLRGDDIGADAAPAGWMFLTGTPPDAVMSTEVYASGRDVEPRVASVSRAASNQKIRNMAAALDRLPETRGADYELRVLRIPAVSTEAFWLKAANPEDGDLIVPFLSLTREVLTGRPYRAAEFLDAVGSLIERATPRRRDGDSTALR